MATSKSRENAAGPWVGIAHLFSGRPDPTWDVAAADVEELWKIWDSLEPGKGDIPRSAPLGYRGCEVHGPDRTELHAFGGVAMMKGAGIVGTQTRQDTQRHLERAILATAPTALIPASVLDRLE